MSCQDGQHDRQLLKARAAHAACESGLGTGWRGKFPASPRNHSQDFGCLLKRHVMRRADPSPGGHRLPGCLPGLEAASNRGAGPHQSAAQRFQAL